MKRAEFNEPAVVMVMPCRLSCVAACLAGLFLLMLGVGQLRLLKPQNSEALDVVVKVPKTPSSIWYLEKLTAHGAFPN
jgi:hypothetical protein